MKRTISAVCLFLAALCAAAQGIYIYQPGGRLCLKSAEIDSVVPSAGEYLYEVCKTDGSTLRLQAAEVDSLVAFESEYTNPVHIAIDLGLPSGTWWADRNVGANSPEDYGDYFAWGETSEKDNYSCSTSVTYGKSYSELQEAGIIDNDGNLTAKYDAATANWGKGWHMPTLTQIEELLNNCEGTWTTKNGVSGYLVTGSNGNSIFLPATGGRYRTSLHGAGSSGYYWSSTPHDSYECDSSDAYYLCFYDVIFSWGNDNGNENGYSVRPVSE